MYNLIRINNGVIEFYSITNRRWQREKTKAVIKLLALATLRTMGLKTAFSGVSSDIGEVKAYVIKDFSTANYNDTEVYFDENSETNRVFSSLVETDY